MSQQHPDKGLNEGRPSQDIEREDDSSNNEEEASIENEVVDEELLSNEELTDVSGGVNENSSHSLPQEVSYHAVGMGTNPLEPGPTFPAPPSLEDAP